MSRTVGEYPCVCVKRVMKSKTICCRSVMAITVFSSYSVHLFTIYSRSYLLVKTVPPSPLQDYQSGGTNVSITRHLPAHDQPCQFADSGQSFLLRGGRESIRH